MTLLCPNDTPFKSRVRVLGVRGCGRGFDGHENTLSYQYHNTQQNRFATRRVDQYFLRHKKLTIKIKKTTD
jgi:hypothetical protein